MQLGGPVVCFVGMFDWLVACLSNRLHLVEMVLLSMASPALLLGCPALQYIAPLVLCAFTRVHTHAHFAVHSCSARAYTHINTQTHGHMCLAAPQEAAIGSTMVHPNIVAVYSITLRPSTATAAQGLSGRLQQDSSSSPKVVLLDQAPAAAGVGDTPQLAAPAIEAAELLPWEMQLVMEYCDQVHSCSRCASLICSWGA